MTKHAILARIHMGEEAAPPQNKEIVDFKAALARITLDVNTRVLTVTFKGKRSAAKWVNWQVPQAMRLLPQVDYEQQASQAYARTPIKLDYYRLTVVVRKGEPISKDMH